MMLVEHAERELRAAGFFDEDSDYNGGLGENVLELVKVFAAQGHSGGSAARTLQLFHRVANYRTLMPLEHPIVTNEFMEVAQGTLQSTRRSSVFSNDNGRTWHDIDRRIPWWKRLFGVRRFVISFPYAG